MVLIKKMKITHTSAKEWVITKLAIKKHTNTKRTGNYKDTSILNYKNIEALDSILAGNLQAQRHLYNSLRFKVQSDTLILLRQQGRVD